jgi:hypothetical protein
MLVLPGEAVPMLASPAKETKLKLTGYKLYTTGIASVIMYLTDHQRAAALGNVGNRIIGDRAILTIAHQEG